MEEDSEPTVRAFESRKLIDEQREALETHLKYSARRITFSMICLGAVVAFFKLWVGVGMIVMAVGLYPLLSGKKR